jgi:3-phosphoshikimate 1-carboxyvinyltransferase
VDRTFEPCSRLRGSIEVPADKSVAHRALILAAMCSGESTIAGRIAGRDVASTRQCIEALGSSTESAGPALLRVSGTGWKTPPEAALDAGNSGTTMRLLTGALAGRPGRFVLSGDESLSSRPMNRVAEPLRRMGARIELAEGAHAPIEVEGGQLVGISYAPEVASAQVKGAILLAGLQAEGTTTVKEALPTRDHTERFLRWLGVPVVAAEGFVTVQGGESLFGRPGFECTIPGDLSSAAYFLVAACLCANSRVEVDDIGLNPGRTGIIEVLEAMGGEVEVAFESDAPEPIGKVTASSSRLSPTELSGELIPRTIDELPLVALAATQAEGTTVIKDAGELRAKESDRIAVLARNLRLLGAKVEEEPDGLSVTGPAPLHGGVVDAAGDHRMAMTFAVAGLIASDPVTVTGWDSAAVSFPEFDRVLRQLLA